MGRLAALSLCRQEDHFGYGAQALVVQGRPPAHGAGQVFGFAGAGGKTSRPLAGRDQAHGFAAWSFVEVEDRQEGLVLETVRRRRQLCPPAQHLLHSEPRAVLAVQDGTKATNPRPSPRASGERDQAPCFSPPGGSDLIARLLLGAHPGAGSVVGCPRPLESSTHAVRTGIRRSAAAAGGLIARWLVFGPLRGGHRASEDQRQEEA